MSVLSPTGTKVALGLGLLGGIASIAFMTFSYKPEKDILTPIALFMLTSVLFFAVAGAYTKNGQWSWRITLFMLFLITGEIVACIITEYFEIFAGVFLLVVGVCILILTMLPSTKEWFNVGL